MDGVKVKIPEKPKTIMKGDDDLLIKDADESKPFDVLLANQGVFLPAPALML